MFRIALFVLLMVAGVCRADDAPACFRNLMQQSFPYTPVMQAFSYNNIQESLWNYLYQQLKANVSQLPDLVRQQAVKMTPNPLEAPFQPELAMILLQRAQYAVFAQVMLTNTVYNANDIQQMFNYIYQEQAQRAEACLGITPPSFMPPGS